ncbi:MAG: MFS transporter [Rhabdochlamydiaceae bacterium]|nr:MFS transporter [Rhabdochlamydiaceae bacterium]
MTIFSRKVAWILWIVASLFYAYQYILRVMPSIMLEDIMRQFQIPATSFGQFSGIYYIGYSLMHIPVGIFLDRFGPRKVMTVCILLTVVGLMPLLFSTHFFYPLLGRACIGIGSSAAILGVFKIIRMAFSEKLFSRMLSFSVMIGLLGAIYGGGPVSYLCAKIGYQTVVQLFALLGVLLAIVTYIVVPSVKVTSQNSVFSDIKEVLSHPKVIGSCLCAGLMTGPLEGFADVWGSTFFKYVYGWEGTIAASVSSMIFIGMCFGSPVLSWISEKAKSPLLTIVGAGLCMIAVFSFMLFYSMSSGLLTVPFLLVGMCCAYQILAIYKASTYVRPEVAGLTTACANMIIMFFGYGFHSIMGKIIDVMGGATNPKALICGVLIIPIALALGTGGFVYLWITEKKKRSQPA